MPIPQSPMSDGDFIAVLNAAKAEAALRKQTIENTQETDFSIKLGQLAAEAQAIIDMMQ